MRDHHHVFTQAQVKLIAVATDSRNHLQKFAKENQFNFTIISDRGAKIVKEYDVYTFGSIVDITYLKVKLAIPSEFLINNSHRIIWRYVGAREDRPSIELIQKAIAKIT